MSTEVVMPQMGESITEGTITRWLKKVGETVERDEMLFEISTDKVDAEIPSPVAGTLTEIKFKEGDTVEVNAVVALIGDGAGAAASGTSATEASVPEPGESPPPAQTPASQAQQATTPAPASQAAVSAPPPPTPPAAPAVQPPSAIAAAPPQAQQSQPAPQAAAVPSPAASAGGAQEKSTMSNAPRFAPAAGDNGGAQTAEDLRRTRSSPLVRNIAKEHGVDISQLEGTGMSGRVTKNDILSFIESGATTAVPAPAAQQQSFAAPVQAPPAPSLRAPTMPPPPMTQPGEGDRVETMSVMRRKIAEHMTMSQRTSAHVATFYEVDMTRIARLREKHKEAFLRNVGTKLTYMPFIFQAVTTAIRRFPIFNSQVSGDQIVYKRDINLGMAVALDWGLIVPVIKRADDLSIAGLARAANDLADRARAKQLKPDEVGGGTFTITNPGVFGGLFGTPIINQPQVAILGVGTIEKRPKVVTDEDGDDYIAIRTMAYFALSFDHRIIDGADAERFLGYVKGILEAGQFTV
ncbi:MAG TPA: dihydrolipoamide acetyltransferase family protein [Pyrinomonadaceae bacterium]|jgi:2-oxoglutarate dehydrogenase E2 component (dihydrolipoamide succinyltransferase)|nr:dihydrolipoamide acetyltransferase family protein [Pyrinomonadaceae bacterium]